MRHEIFKVLAAQSARERELLAALAAVPGQSPRARRRIRRNLARELISHDGSESQVFYKRLEGFEEIRAIVARRRAEKDSIYQDLQRLLNTYPDDTHWTDRLTRLRQAVEEHAASETGELFPVARRLLARREAREMAASYARLQDGRRVYM